MQTTVFSQGFEYGVKHFLSPKAGDLIQVISETLMLPKTEVTFLIELGSVYLNTHRAGSKALTQPGDHIRVHTKPRRYKTDYDWHERVVYNHADFVILNKPGGLPSHPSVDNSIENSLTQLSVFLNEPLYITHRLDTLTEGLIVYSKNNHFTQSFNKQLQNKTITKKYVALVETKNKLPDHVVHYMEPSPRAPKKVSVIYNEDWNLCELKIEKQKIFDHHSWIKINLLTGRTHQIRAQVSDLNAPIIGDHLYGSITTQNDGSIKLRAQEIQFNWMNQMHCFNLPENFDD